MSWRAKPLAGEYERDASSGLLLPRHARRGIERVRPQFMCGPSFFGGSGEDPYWGNVVLLLHMDGSNGSTTFTDSSSSNKAITANGNAQISTAQSKFGGASGAFDGSGDYLSAANSADFAFGSGDFTIEAWVRTSVTTGFHAIIGYANGTAQNSNFEFQLLQNATQWQFNTFIGNSSYGGVAGTASANTWQHVALARQGSNLRAFIDGTLTHTDTSIGSGSINNPSGAVLHIGQLQGFYPWNGYIDDLRITKGVARYTASFTPPSAAFPNS